MFDMYKIENLSIEDLMFLEYAIFLYKERLNTEIIETKIRINKATKEDNVDDYKLYAHMLETKQASVGLCDNLICRIEMKEVM